MKIKPVIAAVNRCATQNQVIAACKPVRHPKSSYRSGKPLRHPKSSATPSFSAACWALTQAEKAQISAPFLVQLRYPRAL
jgi:hypothetical protein